MMLLSALILFLAPSPPASALPTRLVCDYRLEHKATSAAIAGQSTELLVPQFSGYSARIAVPFEPQVLYAAVHLGQDLQAVRSLQLSAWDYAAKMELASSSGANFEAHLFTESVTHRAELSCRVE